MSDAGHRIVFAPGRNYLLNPHRQLRQRLGNRLLHN